MKKNMIYTENTIDVIEERLREYNYEVIKMEKKLLIKLPMSCSITACFDTEFSILAKFGLLDRTVATMIAFFILISFFLINLKNLDSQFVWTIIIVAIIWDVIRWYLTQKAIFRTTQIVDNVAPQKIPLQSTVSKGG